MHDNRRSYLKTIAMAGAALAVASFALAVVLVSWRRDPALPVWTGAFVVAVACVIALGIGILVLVIAGGCIALRRDALEARGRAYAPARRREWLPGPMGLALLQAFRRLASIWAHDSTNLGLHAAELVQVRPLAEILPTLDSRGTLEGTPFMPEMVPFCGRTVRVFRRVEKLNDWVHKTGLHRIRDTVLLEGLRCEGSSHGGCQANCHLRWKEAWLRRVSPRSPAQSTPEGLRPETLEGLERLARQSDGVGGERYVCQATELTAGAPRIEWGDPRHYLRDLLTGNVRPGPFMVGVALALFNAVQRQRGGASVSLLHGRYSQVDPHECVGASDRGIRAGENQGADCPDPRSGGQESWTSF